MYCVQMTPLRTGDALVVFVRSLIYPFATPFPQLTLIIELASQTHCSYPSPLHITLLSPLLMTSLLYAVTSTAAHSGCTICIHGMFFSYKPSPFIYFYPFALGLQNSAHPFRFLYLYFFHLNPRSRHCPLTLSLPEVIHTIFYFRRQWTRISSPIRFPPPIGT